MAYENILTFDLETQTQVMNKRKAQKWHPDNYIVADGWKMGNNPTFGAYHTKKERITIPDLTNIKLLVGMNIKFDLLWLWEYPEIQDFIKRGGKIWDVQYAEYLLEGQQEWAHMLALDGMVENYGGTLKLDVVKEMWGAGIETSDIPEDVLMAYLLGDPEQDLEGDVNNTWLVFMGQLKRIQSMPKNFLPMVRNRMDGLLATTEMENNGLHVDLELGMELREEVANELTEYDKELKQFLPKLPKELEFNWSSNNHKSYIIYGGVAKYQKWVQHRDEETDELLYSTKTEKWPYINGVCTSPEDVLEILESEGLSKFADVCDKYKSGKKIGQIKYKNTKVPDYEKPKGKKQDHFFKFEGYTSPEKRWESSLLDGKGDPIYSTSADVITELSTRNIPFLKAVARRQKLKKELGTYYWEEDAKGKRKGMLTLVNTKTNCIHHSLNHVQTVTSRMSSSNPNLQNIPRKDSSKVKQVFTSRFGDEGVICEIDYSSLEVVVQALLTGDKQLIKDLNNSVDFHCKRLAAKLHASYDVVKECLDKNAIHHKEDEIHPDGSITQRDVTYSEMRTKIKGFTFARAYGAGAVSIAADTGMTVDEVKELIVLEDNMYEGVVKFDEKLEKAITKSRKPTTKEVYVEKQRFILGIGEWFSPTGTRFVWKEGITPEFLWARGKYVGFKPTERKNYPSQGVGGEIVQTMLGLVYRWMIKKNHFNRKALLINTVHDSVYLDIHRSVVNEVVPFVKRILEAVPTKYKHDFNIDVPVPFPCEAEIGPSMYHVSHYKEENYV